MPVPARCLPTRPLWVVARCELFGYPEPGVHVQKPLGREVIEQFKNYPSREEPNCSVPCRGLGF
jgi:hypothetical protein